MARWALAAALTACAGPPAGPAGARDSVAGGAADSADSGAAGGPWRSALYPADWAPGFEVEVEDGGPPALVPDFSYAGYRAGEAPLPTPALDGAWSVLDFGADPTGAADSTAAVQAAIDAAAAAGGGVVGLPEGDYRLDDTITVAASGVVLVGAGSGRTRLSFTAAGPSDGAGLRFAGALEAGPPVLLAADAAAGAFTLTLAEPAALDVGDRVGVGIVITPQFVAEHGMEGLWTFAAGQRRTLFQRHVVAVDGATVTLDAPLRYAVQVRDLADVRVESGAVTGCGLVGLSVSSAVDWEAAWAADRHHAVAFDRVEDCWVSDVASWPGLVGDGTHHLQSGGVIVSRSRRVTLAHLDLQAAQNRGPGGNGYLVELRQSDDVLVRDSVARAGRHNFIQNWDFGTTGCVFLRTRSEGGEAWPDATGTTGRTTGLSEFHHALAMANLVDDSVADDGWGAVNRLTWSSGAGHTATRGVFWNVRGAGELVSLQYGRGAVVGTEGLAVRTEVLDVYDSAHTAPEDWVEGLGQAASLTPRSLYDDQLARRLGR